VYKLNVVTAYRVTFCEVPFISWSNFVACVYTSVCCGL